jgi:hypothetical protein
MWSNMWTKQKMIGLSVASVVTLGPIVMLLQHFLHGGIIRAGDAIPGYEWSYLGGMFLGLALAAPVFGLAWAATATVIWHGFKGRIIVASLVSAVVLFTLAWNLPIDAVVVILVVPTFGGVIHAAWRLLKLLRLVPAEPVDHSPLVEVFA